MEQKSEIVDQILRGKNNVPVAEIESEYDVDEGMMLASNNNAIDNREIRNDLESYLTKLAKEGTQILINSIFKLPTKRVDEVIIAELPKPKLVLPRARHVPKPKAPTKWEQFAKEKGISKKKKGVAKKHWDDVLDKFVPNYGYQKVKAEKQKEWLVELNQNNEPKEDVFATKKNAKVERRAKNEFQRLRNLAKSKNIKIPRAGLPSGDNFPSASQLSTAVTVARAATASLGKFQDRLPKEKDSKSQIAKEVPGLKRKKLAPPANFGEEKRRCLDIVDKVLKKDQKHVKFDMPATSSGGASKKMKKSKKSSVSSSKKTKKGGKRISSSGRASSKKSKKRK